MTRTTLGLTAFALFLALTWVSALVMVLTSTHPAAIAFWSVCGIVNGICAFDVAKHAVEAHVKGW
jgi:hypothetical protein